ncbi:unnamed protein product [Ilex paraguariensis]|uniref:Uncharacterized protein n=1 Tax=Ilex paraguariensis TaxID=185542 RepID=A0ABC8SCQ4_9AQUA
MPLSEFYRMAKSKLESTKQKATCPTDLSFVPDSDVFELVCENGQIMMQGQSSRTRKNPTFTNLPSHSPRFRDKDTGNASTSKLGKFGPMESIVNDIPMLVPSGEMGLSQDDDMLPWLNYQVDNTLQQDYYSELLPEISCVTVNEPSTQSSFRLTGKRNSCNQKLSDSQNLYVQNGVNLEQGNASKVSSSRTRELYPWLTQEGQTAFPTLGTGVSDMVGNNNTSTSQPTDCGDLLQGLASSGGFPSMNMQKQDSGLPCSTSTLLNFSHFSRPAAVVRANLQNVAPVAAPGLSHIQIMGNMNNESAAGGRSPSKSALIDPSSSLQKGMGLHSHPNLVLAKVDSKQSEIEPPLESPNAEQSDAIYQEDAIKNDKSTNEVLSASLTKGVPGGEKTVEPLIASSACSDNSVERASNDPTNTLKRKCRNTDDSDCRSGDVEEESVGARKVAPARGGIGSKRSRAAEVHNLSERYFLVELKDSWFVKIAIFGKLCKACELAFVGGFESSSLPRSSKLEK